MFKYKSSFTISNYKECGNVYYIFNYNNIIKCITV